MMKIHASFRIIILFTQLSLIVLEAQGRRESIDLQEYAKHDTDHEPNIRLDDHFWIYTKKPKDTKHPVEELDDHFWIYTKKPKDTEDDVQGLHDHSWWIYASNNQAKYKHEPETSPHHQGLDPKQLRIFFTPRELESGKTMPLYFPRKNAKTNSNLRLTREEADAIPFSSSKLPSLLELFSINTDSAQGRAMKNTLEQCEVEPVNGEVKFCATSRESMVESVNQIFSSGMKAMELATNYHFISMVSSIQNFTIIESPKQVDASKMIGCHPMQYPYAVFYCHSQLESGQNKLYHVSLAGDNGDRVDALAVCHMDTSLWDPAHVAFRALSVRPGSDSPVCHFFPEDSLVWVPVPTSNHA